MKITEDIMQRQSVGHSNHNCGTMRKGRPNELVHIFGKPIFDRLHRSLGKGHGVSLCLASHFECTSWMERAWLLPLYENNQ